MRRPIAKIRINAGNPGWYDPLTNIHLTITRPTATVYEGSNTTNIKNAITHKLLYVYEGSLEVVKQEEVETVSLNEVREVPAQTEIIEEQPKQETIETVIEEVQEVTEEVVETTEEIVTEETIEAVKEEVVEEPKQEKATTKKKASKKKTAKAE